MKKLTIMRGSGKSTRAKETGGVICSADDYFIGIDGVYVFDASKLSEAHAECFAKAKKAMQYAVPSIVIDNTNTQRWEFERYIRLAKTNGYKVYIETPTTYWAWDAEECARRNAHGVPLNVIQTMKDRFEL